MPTASEEAALAEADAWMSVARHWAVGPLAPILAARPPVESRVIPEVDPSDDLSRRAARWSFEASDALSDVCRFAAGLADVERRSWRDRDPSVATRAYADRRFLAADRIVPWVVPWLDAAAELIPDGTARQDRDTVLDIAERLRVAPLVVGAIALPGEDGYGPVGSPVGLEARVGSLWGGRVWFPSRLRRLDSGDIDSAHVAEVCQGDAARWSRMVEQWPGSAAFWADLAERSATTARLALTDLPTS